MTFFGIFFKKVCFIFKKGNSPTPPSPVHSSALARANREVG